MIQNIVCGAIGVVMFTLASGSVADVNAARANYNYQMFCQGCHTPDGSGGRNVPMLKDSIGTFLKSQQGREYLIRVPGAANAPLTDAQLAELMNWNIEKFGGASIPEQWQHYTAEEVAQYRQHPLLEVIEYRKKVLA
ncbi:MAG: c-type cytochrome, partial [Pseudomonadales bacterium]